MEIREITDDVEDSTVPQTIPISDDQVRNNAGGFVWKVDDMNRLKRFLCLGSEGGTYYTNEKQLTAGNARCITRMIQEQKGEDVVRTVRQFSLDGRTAKQSSIMFALAVCVRSDDPATKKLAYSVLNDICRIPTFLFEFIQKCESLGEGTGWGRAQRTAIMSWYNQFSENPLKLAMLVTKYRNRNKWSHRDVIRLSHARPVNDAIGAILRYLVKDLKQAKEMYNKSELHDDANVKKVLEFLTIVDQAKECETQDQMIRLIKDHGLVREHVPTRLLSYAEVWEELLQDMPMTAMIRNLGKMSSVEILDAGSVGEGIVVEKLSDETVLKKARIHPFNVLVALKTYTSGQGLKGKLTWKVNRKIVSALDAAFYKAFKFVAATKKRYLLAVDVSGSMSTSVMGTPAISCRVAAAAMMMVTRRTEADSTVVAFHDTLQTLDIQPNHDLSDVVKTISGMSFGATDCSLPMTWAKQRKKMFDVFVVYTDSETYYGKQHPSEALREYRKWSGLWDARLIVCGMSSNEFTIANPDDPGMMDVVGFDSAAPEAMRSFVMGEL